MLLGALAGANFDALSALRRVLVVTRPPRAPAEGSGHPHHTLTIQSGPELEALRIALKQRPELAGLPLHIWNSAAKSGNTLLEQLRLVSSSSIIIYSHGAAHANFLAVAPGTLLVEFTPYFEQPSLAAQQCLKCAATLTSRELRKRGDSLPSASCLAEGTQALNSGRRQGQTLAALLRAEGMPVSHIAVLNGAAAPHSPSMGSGAMWNRAQSGCLPAHALVSDIAHALPMVHDWRAMPRPDGSAWHWDPEWKHAAW